MDDPTMPPLVPNWFPVLFLLIRNLVPYGGLDAIGRLGGSPPVSDVP